MASKPDLKNFKIVKEVKEVKIVKADLSEIKEDYEYTNEFDHLIK